MTRLTAYRALCGFLGGLFVLLGIGCLVAFIRYHAPGGESPGPFVLGPDGIYFMAFTGATLIGWGGCLAGAARQPEAAPWLATASAVAMVIAAVCRMLAWIVGDYAVLGNLLRVEAALLLVGALALIWLKPSATRSLQESLVE